LPATEASLNTYLNGDYYQSLAFKDLIATHLFNVGLVEMTGSLSNNVSQEKANTWRGKIGLMTVTDYIKANSDMTNCGTVSTSNTNNTTCKDTNWILTGNNGNIVWIISPLLNGNSALVWLIYSYGFSLSNGSAYQNYMARPVFYLPSTIEIDGSGTNNSSIYKITNLSTYISS